MILSSVPFICLCCRTIWSSELCFVTNVSTINNKARRHLHVLLTAMDSVKPSVLSSNGMAVGRWRSLAPAPAQVFVGSLRRQGVIVRTRYGGIQLCQSVHSTLRASNALSKKQQMITKKGSLLFGMLCASANVDLGGTVESTSTKPNEEAVQSLKKAVMNAVSNTNRGKDATYQQKQTILNLLEELEDLNPTTNPVDSKLFSGSWALLYTAPVNEKTADKYAGTEEGPFLARVKPAAFGSVRQIRSTQVLDPIGGTASNIADFVAFGVNGSLDIKGSVTKAPSTEKGSTRVDVKFESFVLEYGDWKSPNISLRWINPKGWIETTFLDKDMRIGRGDKGSIFVAVRKNQI